MAHLEDELAAIRALLDLRRGEAALRRVLASERSTEAMREAAHARLSALIEDASIKELKRREHAIDH